MINYDFPELFSTATFQSLTTCSAVQLSPITGQQKWHDHEYFYYLLPSIKKSQFSIGCVSEEAHKRQQSHKTDDNFHYIFFSQQGRHMSE